MEIIHNINKLPINKNTPIYQCCNCNRLFNWDDKSRWYGSYAIMENNPEKIKYYCDIKCYETNT